MQQTCESTAPDSTHYCMLLNTVASRHEIPNESLRWAVEVEIQSSHKYDNNTTMKENKSKKALYSLKGLKTTVYCPASYLMGY